MPAWGYNKVGGSLIKDFLLKVIGIPHPYGRLRVKNALKYIKISAERTLDLGSGEGVWVLELSRRSMDIFGIDISLDSLKNTKNILCSSGFQSKIVQSDVQKLPFKKNSFDQVICLDVLEHVEAPDKVFKEIYRCLKKKGQFVITIPNELYLVKSVLPVNLKEHAKAMGHVGNGINYQKLRILIEKNDFRLVEYNYFGKTFSRIFTELLYFLMGAKSIRDNRKRMYSYSIFAFIAFCAIYPLMHLDYILTKKTKGAFIAARIVKKG